MGEYAKLHGESVKIGTCESMYYLRFEDIYMLKPEVNSVDITKSENQNNMYFRLPLPNENKILPGHYKSHIAEQVLYIQETENQEKKIKDVKKFEKLLKDLAETKGNLQLTGKNGYLVNISCFHGFKLPKESEEIKIFWNGQDSHQIVLSSLKKTGKKLIPVVKCKYCGESWSCDWDEIWDFIPEKLKNNLKKYYFKNLEFSKIDSFNRPVFKCIYTNKYYCFLNKLYTIDEIPQIKNLINEKLYFKGCNAENEPDYPVNFKFKLNL